MSSVVDGYDTVKSSARSDSLFSCSWKPGFFVRKGHIVAVKCKRTVECDVEDDADPTIGAPKHRNIITLTRVYAFRDGKFETDEAFRTNSQPARIAVWCEAKSDYVDRGWGVPLKITSMYLVFDVSDTVQLAHISRPYPLLVEHEPVHIGSGVPLFQQCKPTNQSRRVKYDGHVYDSTLEARHAVFFSTLGIEYEPHARRFATPWGDWKIDYTLPGVCHVEIKPTDPLLEEEARCATACMQDDLPVVVLYGAIGAPFARSDPRSDIVTYERHVAGVRGWKYERVHTEGSCVKRTPVVWTERVPGHFALEQVHLPHVDLAWETPALVNAYELALSHVFEDCSS